eukprot:8188850-Pyramimonas_sp.AAC.1
MLSSCPRMGGWKTRREEGQKRSDGGTRSKRRPPPALPASSARQPQLRQPRGAPRASSGLLAPSPGGSPRTGAGTG